MRLTTLKKEGLARSCMRVCIRNCKMVCMDLGLLLCAGRMGQSLMVVEGPM